MIEFHVSVSDSYIIDSWAVTSQSPEATSVFLSGFILIWTLSVTLQPLSLLQRPRFWLFSASPKTRVCSDAASALGLYRRSCYCWGFVRQGLVHIQVSVQDVLKTIYSLVHFLILIRVREKPVLTDMTMCLCWRPTHRQANTPQPNPTQNCKRNSQWGLIFCCSFHFISLFFSCTGVQGCRLLLCMGHL